jgi:hypothetical protein
LRHAVVEIDPTKKITQTAEKILQPSGMAIKSRITSGGERDMACLDDPCIKYSAILASNTQEILTRIDQVIGFR